MGQIRLHYTAPKLMAEHLYQLADIAFGEDAYPMAITEIDEKNQIYELSLYVDESEQAEVLTRFANALNMAQDQIGIEVLPDIDWVSHSLAGLKPVRAGRFFVHGRHDRDKIRANDLSIEIEAGQAFGTGHHGTTSGCLEMITQVMRRERPMTALDLGTGSGVLAIGMAKLQPAAILASDIDPIATKVAKENIILNGVSERVKAVTATGFHHIEILSRAPFNLIVANILARPLMNMAPQMAKAMARNGSLILSGILDEQRDRVLAAYRNQGIYHVQTFHREGWVTLHLK